MATDESPRDDAARGEFQAALRRAGDVLIHLQPGQALALYGALRICATHPQLPQPTLEMLQQLCGLMEQHFAGEPAILRRMQDVFGARDDAPDTTKH